MNVRTFVASSMNDALQQVKRGLGSDAVVLHTRTYRRGGLFGFGAKTYVEVTAADGRELARKRAREAKQSPRAQRLAQARAAKPATHPAPPRPEPTAGDLIRKTYQAAQAQFSAAPATASAGATATAAPAAGATAVAGAGTVAATPAPTTDTAAVMPPPAPGPITNVAPITGGADQLAQEMQAVRQMVARVMHQQSRQAGVLPTAPGKDPLFEHYLGLIEQEVAEELAEQIVDEARGLTDAVDPDDKDAGRDAVRGAIERAMPIDPDAGQLRATEDGRARVIALVGPTGVGKTTTVAKLAATFKLKQGKDVALVTLDTYRIAAVDQLKTYAGILGVPLEVVTSPEQMTAAIQRHAHRDGILIDTAGRSQRDSDRLGELAAFIEAANPHETHLVLSSTATQRVLLETVDRFSAIHTDRIIFTKLDEAVTFGTLLNVASKVKKKLSYLTTGQEVPHQIEAGKADRLAALVMGEALCQ